MESGKPMPEPEESKKTRPVKSEHLEKEETKELIPTKEQIDQAFRKLAGGAGYKTRENGFLEDKEGVYLWDVIVEGKVEGEWTEFGYRRGVLTYNKKEFVNEISVSEFLDGMPCSGTEVARYVDGKWKYATKDEKGEWGKMM